MEESIIKLNNDKFILVNKKYIDKTSNIAFIDITNNNFWNILKKDCNIIFSIDFKNITDTNYEKVIKRIIKVKSKCINKNITIGIKQNEKVIVGAIDNYHEDIPEHKSILIAINAILYGVLKQRYEYLYDEICEYLDNQFITNNYCDFKNDQCIANRKSKFMNNIMGCCHSSRYNSITKITYYRFMQTSKQ